MGGGYQPPANGTEETLAARRQARDAQRPSGTRLAGLVAQVQAALANINATVSAAIAANSYTKTQIDSKIANPPSSVAVTGNLSTTGQVISAGVIQSPGTKANTVTVGYSSLWADSSGNFGANTSSRRYKQDITPVQTDRVGLLELTTYKFRYIAAVEEFGDAAPWEYGLIAEDVVEVAPWACFYEDDGMTVKGINYDRLVVVLLNVVQDHESRIVALEAKA